MPVERKFKQGSIIYFDHEIGDSVFIMKAGSIELSYIQPETGEKINKAVTQGEFFGLKSAIISHTRDEIAEAVSDSLTIEFKIPEFEAYVSKNVELLKRLLRVLSNQLRNLGIKANNFLGNNMLSAPNIGIFKIGEYYLNNRQYKQAIQVYQRYIEQYADTNIVQEAKYRIAICEEAMKTGYLKDFKPIDNILGGDVTAATTNITQVADTKDSMENAHSPLGVRDFMDKYYKAQSFFKGQDYTNAEKMFNEIFSMETASMSQEMVNDAKLMSLITMFKLKKFNECSQQAMEFIKTIKDNKIIKKTLFILADMYQSLNNSEGEKSILQKILLMAPVDDLSKTAKDRMSRLK